MQILADENLPGPMVARLRQDGFEVIAIKEVAAGVDDTVVMQAANERSVMLVTQDRDFGELVVRRELPILGVILVQLERLPLATQIERLSECLQVGLAEFVGHFTVVEPARIRKRLLQGGQPT